MGATMPFDRHTLETALHELGRRTFERGRTIEIGVYGGCAVMLTLHDRLATRDVDAVFERDRTFIRRIAADIAEEFGWESDWLNDGVKGWLSAADSDPEAKRLVGTYPSEDQPGLRVFIPRPEYLFAMKARAMRVGGVESSQDIEDLRRLAGHIGITTLDQAMDIVLSFYPAGQLQPKTRLGLEEILSRLDGDEPDEAG